MCSNAQILIYLTICCILQTTSYISLGLYCYDENVTKIYLTEIVFIYKKIYRQKDVLKVMVYTKFNLNFLEIIKL